VMDTDKFTVSSLKASYNDFVSRFLRYTKNSNVIVTATSAYDLAAGKMFASIPYDGGANERLIRGGEETNYFYRSNERDHIITLFDIQTLAKAKTIKHDDYSSNLTISPNGKYLAGTFSQSELRGNSRVLINAYIRILEMRGDELVLLHEELLDQKDYHTELVFAKRNDAVFVIKGEGFYRFDIKKDGKVNIVKFNFTSINDNKSYLNFHYKQLQAYARRWDIETGNKTSPYWEMLYPTDSSRIFPFYEDSPPPVSFSAPIHYNSSDWVPASK
jgi:WD40 repeat protein